MTFKKDKRVME